VDTFAASSPGLFAKTRLDRVKYWSKLLLNRRGRKATARTTIACRKSEAPVSSPHEQFRASVWPRPPLPSRRLAAPWEKAARKILPTKTPRNPLKSLDSDERIQGNPRKSKAQKRSLQTETRRAPRKPKHEPPDQPPGPPSRRKPTDLTQMQSALGAEDAPLGSAPLGVES
jgi:hypothetical protein